MAFDPLGLNDMIMTRKIQIGAQNVARLTLILTANWGFAVGFAIYAGIGKGSTYLPIFWILDVAFCPLVCATLAGLLAYGHFRHGVPFTGLTRLATIFGLLPFIAWSIPFLLSFLNRVH